MAGSLGPEGTSRQPKGRLAPDTLRSLILVVLLAQAPREALVFLRGTGGQARGRPGGLFTSNQVYAMSLIGPSPARV